MIDNLLCILSAIVIFLGMFFFFYALISKGLCFGAKRNFYTVIAGHEENSALADEIYCATVQANLFNFSLPSPVIVIDYGLTEETRKKCEIICEGCGRIIFCSEDELTEIISQGEYLCPAELYK